MKNADATPTPDIMRNLFCAEMSGVLFSHVRQCDECKVKFLEALDAFCDEIPLAGHFIRKKLGDPKTIIERLTHGNGPPSE